MNNTIIQTITVDKALKRGQQIMRYPTVFIVIAFIFLSIIVISKYNLSPFFILFMGVAAIFLACLYWCNASIWWRLWAFANVRNVHELKARAIKKGLMDATPNFFTRLEFWTPSQKEKWQALQYKFNQPDIFIDDDSVPVEMAICYSKINAVYNITGGVLILCFSVWLHSKHTSWVSLLIAAVVGTAFLALGIILLCNRKPQIIINAAGITVPPRPFSSWAQIRDEDVVKGSSNKTGTRYLVYRQAATSEKVNLIGLNVTPDRMEYLLRVYRGRSKKK